MNIPRQEYPRPQFEREEWINLNGEWDFEIDYAESGEDRKFYERSSLENKITIPFCPESELSGINNKDFMPCVWYRKNFEVPKEYSQKEVILHFGAVDYYAIVYINGKKAAEHKGGYTPFSVNISEYIQENENYITVCAYDNLRANNQPAGKQSYNFKSHGAVYTRTTGIWQTVWMESVNKAHIEDIKVTTDIDTPTVTVGVKVTEAALGKTVKIKALWNGETVGESGMKVFSPFTGATIKLSEKHLWEIGKGGLYDVEITLEDETREFDRVKSYFGLRSVALDGRKFKINGETVFGRWVLDQGYYPDGIYTAPSDEALKNDILYSMQLGFNGARLHEKVFEPRFLYWADKLGYMVWGEHANWGLNITEAGQIQYFLPEWIEAVERDYNHPALIGWCPFNETWDFRGKQQCDMVLEMVYRVTKAIDRTRPVIDASGFFHVITDIYDTHDYEQDPERLASYYAEAEQGKVISEIDRNPVGMNRQEYDGKMPIFVSEYGGIKWSDNPNDGWGYGNGPKTEEEFLERYKALTEVLLFNKNIMGFCYTQLYDVEQEQNGLMTYGREFKFNPEIIKTINTQKAAIEEL